MTDEDDYRELQDQLRREAEAAEADAPFPWVREPFHTRDGSLEYYWVHPSDPEPLAVRWLDHGWRAFNRGAWEPVRGPVCPLPRPPMHPALRVTMVRDRGQAKPEKAAAKLQGGTVEERAAKLTAYLRALLHGYGWHDVRDVARKFRWPDLDEIMRLAERRGHIQTRELTTSGRPRRQWRLTDER